MTPRRDDEQPDSGQTTDEETRPSDVRNEPESFADLLGDARPIDRGPTRVEPRRPVRPRKSGPGNADETEGTSRFRWPDPEDRHCAGIDGVSDAQLAALRRGEPAPEERIDLHGARRDAAGRLLTKRLESARTRGLSCVLVIHGRGQRSPTDEAVLRDALPEWLTRGRAARHVLAFAPAPDRHGGLGATLVQLRRR
jgi:DNA-nicking Smr family endonuclease